MTRNAIAALVLVVIAAAAIVVVVLRMRGPSSAGDRAFQSNKRLVKCLEPGCDFTVEMSFGDAQKNPPGPVGKNGLWQCPKCKKFSAGFYAECPKHGPYVTRFLDMGCPKCAAEAARARSPRK